MTTAETPLAGRTLSHYTILKHIGSGGMGDVYLARDTRLDRTVAIKILPQGVALDPERMRRFAQEARAASALDHPNVAYIYEIGEAEGTRFIVMQYVDGSTLGAKIQDRPLPTREIVRIAIQVADALDDAHAKGIVHRDIKPANIMLSSRGHVKVVDFGLAKLRQDDLPTDTGAPTEALSPSSPGLILGTVQYLSPEQATGKPVDHRSDVFSLGVVLYQMATGRLPFAGVNSVELILSILNDEPEALARFNYSLPPELERIIRKCLEKDPDRRYQSARELGVDLRNLERDLEMGHSSSARAAAAPPRRTGAFAAALAAAVAVAGLAAALYLANRHSPAIDSIAILPFANAGADPDAEYLSDGITESLIDNLARLPRLRVMARATVFTYRGRMLDPRQVGRELRVASVLTGSLRRRDGRVTVKAELVSVADGSRLWGEQYERGLSDLLGIQEQIAGELSALLRPRLAAEQEQRVRMKHTASPEAYQLYLMGRYHWNKRTDEGFAKAIECFRQAIEKDPSYALAYAGLADAYTLMPAWGFLPPQEGHPQARAAATQALALDTGLAEAHAALAHTLHNFDWDWAGAEREYRRAIELNPSYAVAHHWLADCLSEMGRTEEALAEKRRALELDPLSLVMNAELGMILYQGRQYDRAIAQLRKTLELDARFPLAHQFLGFAYEAKEMYPEAIEAFRAALRLAPGNLELQADLGHAYGRAGRKAEAEAILRDLERVSKDRYVVAFDRAMLHASLGRRDEAFAWLGRAFDEHSYQVSALKVDPRADTLREDPRFAELLRRLRLPG